MIFNFNIPNNFVKHETILNIGGIAARNIRSLLMKIIGISGSPRDKNTNYMLKAVLEATGQDYELVALKDKNIHSCNACGGCYHSHKCVVMDDMQELYEKIIGADAIVLGSPSYFQNVTALMKSFIDRCVIFCLSQKLKDKKAALVSVGNFKEGEVEFSDGYSPNKAMKDTVLKMEMEDSVKKCIDNLNNFCNIIGLRVVGSVFAINSDPDSVKEELKELGRKLIA